MEARPSPVTVCMHISPSYDYDDMVDAQHLLLTQGLHVDHLRLILGTSMGCMHIWIWGETHPGFSDALMPLACLPVQIAGRNRMMRKMAMDAIQEDPAWNHGDYTAIWQNYLKELLEESEPKHWRVLIASCEDFIRPE